MMDVTEDTIPELQPIFHFLNGHANKLYQEGYFLKLDDQNTRMFLFSRPAGCYSPIAASHILLKLVYDYLTHL